MIIFFYLKHLSFSLSPLKYTLNLIPSSNDQSDLIYQISFSLLSSFLHLFPFWPKQIMDPKAKSARFVPIYCNILKLALSCFAITIIIIIMMIIILLMIIYQYLSTTNSNNYNNIMRDNNIALINEYKLNYFT